MSVNLHCIMSVTLHCTMSVTLHCTMFLTLHCTMSVTLHCTMSVTLHCTMSVTFQCTISVTLHCTMSATFHCTTLMACELFQHHRVYISCICNSTPIPQSQPTHPKQICSFYSALQPTLPPPSLPLKNYTIKKSAN